MNHYGLIGYPLSHSFSKQFFEEKFTREAISDCAYDLFPLKSIDDLPDLISNKPLLKGLNVTIPYKEKVVPFLQYADEVVKATGACNCIKIIKGELYGYNTDVFGFEVSLTRFLNGERLQAFVLGTGGSSKAVTYVLSKLNIPYYVVSRQNIEGTIAYAAIGEYLEAANLFINCTPAGMYPNIDEYPHIPYTSLTQHDYLFDLVYNPYETQFLLKGKEQGANGKNGLEMLQLQAERSWEIWTMI